MTNSKLEIKEKIGIFENTPNETTKNETDSVLTEHSELCTSSSSLMYV